MAAKDTSGITPYTTIDNNSNIGSGLAYIVKRGQIINVDHFHVRPGFDQEPDRINTTIEASNVKGCGFRTVSRIDISTFFDQKMNSSRSIFSTDIMEQ